jgi:secreted PhoX family phosphatase
VLYDETSTTPVLTGVDNITLDREGAPTSARTAQHADRRRGPDQQAVPVVEFTGVTGSEVTGPAFSPDGTRLYFSSQRNPGRTYEVTGPWH